MNPYTLTAIFVACCAYYVLSRKAPARHAWPMYVRIVLAWAIGLFWPLLTLWAVGWCLRAAIVAAWRWVLGDRNKRRIIRIDTPPVAAMSAFDEEQARAIIKREMFDPLYGPDGKLLA